MTRHELHLAIQKTSIEITIIMTVCISVTLFMLLVIPSALNNANALIILNLAAILHGIAFINCMSKLLKEKEQLEEELQKIDKK